VAARSVTVRIVATDALRAFRRNGRLRSNGRRPLRHALDVNAKPVEHMLMICRAKSVLPIGELSDHDAALRRVAEVPVRHDAAQVGTDEGSPVPDLHAAGPAVLMRDPNDDGTTALIAKVPAIDVGLGHSSGLRRTRREHEQGCHRGGQDWPHLR
jgi:hypothetical protein